MKEDTLPDHIKGTVVWVEEGENEGYCIYNRTSGYTPVEYLKDLRKWAIVVKSKTSGQWFTFQLAPHHYQTVPIRSQRTVFGIPPDTFTPEADPPEDTTQPEEPPQQTNPAPAMSQTQPVQASTSTTTPSAPLRGSGGGGAPAPAPGGGGGGGGGGRGR
ncbi:hypothetical protein BJY52DRAFT_1232429, partial [Lactarius psammicola]